MSRRFRFRLDKVLRARQRTEDAIRLDLARVHAEIRGVRSRIESLSGGLIEVSMDSVLALPHPGESLRRHEGRLLAIEASIDVQRGKEKELLEELSRVEEKLIRARRDRMVVERLREKRLLQHRLSEQREERKEMDEVAVRRHVTAAPTPFTTEGSHRG
jgi:flagellar FliJ protein